MLHLEWLCLQEFAHFARRHPRYLFLGLAFYLYSLRGWGRLRPMRAGYCLAQHIDDVLDGQRHINEPPTTYVAALVQQIATNTYHRQTPMSQLAEYVCARDATIRQELLALIAALQFDYQRRTTQAVLPGATLATHHQRTFEHSINLTLHMLGATLRATDVPALVGAFCWVSPIRDLREDLQLGLINIPAEVLAQAQAQGAQAVEYASLITTPAVQTWLRQEFAQGQAHLRACAQQLPTLRGQRGAWELYLFYLELNRYAQRYARKQRALLEGT